LTGDGVRRKQITIGLIFAVTVVAGVVFYAAGAGVASFLLAAAALAGLAWLVSEATEAVGERFGPAVTGILQSAFGNLPELFVVFFALRAGQEVVAQTAILGSIFANSLLVLGLVILAGVHAAPDSVMRFHKRLPQDTSTLLILAVFIIVLLGLSVGSADLASRHRLAISAVGAVALIGVYAFWLVGYVRSDRRPEPIGRGESSLSFMVAIVLLGAGGVAAAFVSDWFVGSLDPALTSLGLSKPFAGLVIVGIAGNAVENVTGIVLAAKGRSDLAISVVKNSISQIALFLYPALVLVSLPMATHLTFVIAPVYAGALAFTALALWQVTGDGEGLAFEGVALVALYVILAVVAFYE
jgi:Ca2+:H+ antiporter